MELVNSVVSLTRVCRGATSLLKPISVSFFTISTDFFA